MQAVKGQRKYATRFDFLPVGCGMKKYFALIMLALLLTGCGDDRFPDYHYKITIFARGKTFSSVRAVEQEEVSSIQDSSGRTVHTKLKGEAVILDLPGGQTVFALLSGEDSPQQAKYIAGAALMPMIRTVDNGPRYNDPANNPGSTMEGNAEDEQAMVKIAGPHDLPRVRTMNALGRPYAKPVSLWPIFVSFGDPQNPKSVRKISPNAIGVDRITIEITDDDVTTGIEKRLGWLTLYSHENRSLSGDGGNVVSTNDVRDNLATGAFTQGNGW